MDFEGFPKIGRLNRGIVITEKIDGTNAQIAISDDGLTMQVGSRKRWITPEDDNFGFAGWARENETELLRLGPGRHFGEWWGGKIQRGYGREEKTFSLFNSGRWSDAETRPLCCDVVPVLYAGKNTTEDIERTLDALREHGSVAQEGYMNPEGVVVFHSATRTSFKVTLDRDGVPKGQQSS